MPTQRDTPQQYDIVAIHAHGNESNITTPNQKNRVYLILFLKNSRTYTLIYSNSKSVVACRWRCVGRGKGKAQWGIKNFWGDGYVHYLNYSDSFTGIHLCQKFNQLYILKMYSYYVIYTSIKLETTIKT